MSTHQKGTAQGLARAGTDAFMSRATMFTGEVLTSPLSIEGKDQINNETLSYSVTIFFF